MEQPKRFRHALDMLNELGAGGDGRVTIRASKSALQNKWDENENWVLSRTRMEDSRASISRAITRPRYEAAYQLSGAMRCLVIVNRYNYLVPFAAAGQAEEDWLGG